jgi:hypothetical protein
MVCTFLATVLKHPVYSKKKINVKTTQKKNVDEMKVIEISVYSRITSKIMTQRKNSTFWNSEDNRREFF